MRFHIEKRKRIKGLSSLTHLLVLHPIVNLLHNFKRTGMIQSLLLPMDREPSSRVKLNHSPMVVSIVLCTKNFCNVRTYWKCSKIIRYSHVLDKSHCIIQWIHVCLKNRFFFFFPPRKIGLRTWHNIFNFSIFFSTPWIRY